MTHPANTLISFRTSLTARHNSIRGPQRLSFARTGARTWGRIVIVGGRGDKEGGEEGWLDTPVDTSKGGG